MGEDELIRKIMEGLPNCLNPSEYAKEVERSILMNRTLLGLGPGSVVEYGNPNLAKANLAKNQNVADPPASADKIKLARWMADEARKAGLPPELPVMTVLVENPSFSNPDYGDRDSVGLFQQRASWGPKEARLNPAVALKMFLSAAKQVKGRTSYHYQDGASSTSKTVELENSISYLVANAKTETDRAKYIGIWCQMVQRSAYSSRYGAKFNEAKKLIGQ